jgi:hypothetical protein
MCFLGLFRVDCCITNPLSACWWAYLFALRLLAMSCRGSLAMIHQHVAVQQVHQSFFQQRLLVQVGPALPQQLAGRLSAMVESQEAMAQQYEVLVTRHRERVTAVLDINETIKMLRKGHIVGFDAAAFDLLEIAVCCCVVAVLGRALKGVLSDIQVYAGVL